MKLLQINDARLRDKVGLAVFKFFSKCLYTHTYTILQGEKKCLRSEIIKCAEQVAKERQKR